MGHRHFTNAFDFGINQPHNYNNSSAEQPNVPMGPIPFENPTFISPMDNNMLSSGSNTDIHWNSEGRAAHEYSSSNFSTQVQHLPPPFPTQPYNPYPHSSLARNMYPVPQINTSHVNSSYYNRPPFIHDVDCTFPDPTTAVSGSHKRKRPAFSEPWERGRFSGAGSTSGSSQLPLENPISNHQSVPQGPIGSSQYVPAEDSSMRNVRSRSRLYMEPHLPSYPSHHYHSTTFSRNPSRVIPIGNPNGDVTPREWTHVPLFATHGRRPTSDSSGSRNEANRFLGEGSAGEIGSCHHNFVSTGYPVSSSQYLHGPHPSQATREGGNYHSRRPFYRTNLSYSQLGNEANGAATFVDNGLHSHHPDSLSYRYSREASVGGLHNGYRNGGRSINAIERLQSIPSVVDGGPEFLMVGDHSPIYDGSRSSFDQYRDMRLDIDSMSYEELLALGERIGDVSTGVSEDMMPNCLVEKLYCSMDQKHEEENCAICLYEYEAGGGIGELKNCGHEYHVGCIRKWLLMKNVCPICKAAALKDCSTSNQ